MIAKRLANVKPSGVAKEKNRIVLSDDIYDKYLFETEHHHCMGQIYPKTLTLGGFRRVGR